MIKTNSKSSKNKKMLIWLIVAVGIFALVVALLELTNTTHLFHAQKAVSGTIPSTPAPSSTSKNSSKGDKNTSTPTDQSASTPAGPPENNKNGDTPTSPPSAGSPPITPFGDFVSNHSPNLSGSPNPSTIESVCNTSPGALCSIQFTNSQGVVKTLTAQTTDANGATYWSWDVKKAGLTAGSWKITATAKLNNQTATASSAQNLEVKP